MIQQNLLGEKADLAKLYEKKVFALKFKNMATKIVMIINDGQTGVFTGNISSIVIKTNRFEDDIILIPFNEGIEAMDFIVGSGATSLMIEMHGKRFKYTGMRTWSESWVGEDIKIGLDQLYWLFNHLRSNRWDFEEGPHKLMLDWHKEGEFLKPELLLDYLELN